MFLTVLKVINWFLTKKTSASIVGKATSAKITMNTLEKTVGIVSDWTFDRVHELCEAGQYENAYALRREFMEWMDAGREDEIDVCSIEYIED